MFKIDYNINEDDYLNFNEFHALNSAVGKNALNFYKMIFPVISALAVLIFIIAKAKPLLITIEVLFLGAVSIVWVMFSKKGFLRTLRKGIERSKIDGKLPFSESGTLVFDDEYITDTNSQGENKVRYEGVEKVFVADTAIYICYSAAEAFIVPFKAFESEDEREALIAFLNDKTKTNN